MSANIFIAISFLIIFVIFPEQVCIVYLIFITKEWDTVKVKAISMETPKSSSLWPLLAALEPREAGFSLSPAPAQPPTLSVQSEPLHCYEPAQADQPRLSEVKRGQLREDQVQHWVQAKADKKEMIR